MTLAPFLLLDEPNSTKFSLSATTTRAYEDFTSFFRITKNINKEISITKPLFFHSKHSQINDIPIIEDEKILY